MAQTVDEREKAFNLFLMTSDSRCLGGSQCRSSFSCITQYRREADTACTKRLFAQCDSDKDGLITLPEAQSILHQKFGLASESSRKIMQSYVTPSDGQLSYSEFAILFYKVKQKLKEIRTIFDEFDSNHDGYVTVDDAKYFMSQMGFHSSEVEALVLAHDANKDGRLDYDDFIGFWLCR